MTWQMDHALQLYPVPHVVVLADRAAQYNHMYTNAFTFFLKKNMVEEIIIIVMMNVEC